MVWFAAAGAALGMASAISGQRAAAKEADRKREAEMLAAKMQYAATESSVNLMKASSREQTTNAVQEALRAGAANSSDVNKQITQVASQAMAQSEGLTSGRSKGRQMVSLYIKGNDALQKTQSQTTSVINQMVDKQDQYTNDLNNKLMSAHQQMANVLTTPGNIYQGSNAAILQAGIQGAQAGASLGSSFGSLGSTTPIGPTMESGAFVYKG